MAAQDNIFTKLQKLFSTNVIIRRTGGNRLRVIDSDHIQAFGKTNMQDRYARIMGTGGVQLPYKDSAIQTNVQAQRLAMFRDYEVMEQDPIIASAIDIFSEETTLKNEYGEVLTVKCDDEDIKQILENLYYDILNIEFNLPPWIRSLAKYGDTFLFLEIAEGLGIVNVLPLSIYDTLRIEGEDPKNPHDYYFRTGGMGSNKETNLENYEVAHFRLLTDNNYAPYGRSLIEPARRIFRQLYLMEDAMLIHRIMRAPQKRIFKIDVGSIPPNEVETHINNLVNKTKKIPYIDPQTGDYNLRFNIQNLIEDYYLPVRGKDNATSIDTLSGLEYNAIEDVNYLLNKLFAALKIPKAFFGYDEAISGKLTLAAEDVRFARTVEKVQRTVISELQKIGVIHLYSQGYRDEKLEFSLSLSSPSSIYEQEKVSLWNEKVRLATDAAASKTFSTNWVYKNVFKMSEEDIIRERELISADAKRAFRYSQLESGMSDPAKYGYPQDSPQQETNEVDDGTPGNQMNKTYDMPGRPAEGMKYGKDSHPRGRDPIGFKERYQIADPEISGESLKINNDNILTERKQIWNDSGTFMDDENL